MHSFQVKYDARYYRRSAIMLAGIFGTLGLATVILLATYEVDWGGPFTVLLTATFVIFGVWSFFNRIRWLFRVSKLEAPAFSITEHGIIHHNGEDKFLSWQEIDLIYWKTESAMGVKSRVLRIKPKSPKIDNVVSEFLGRSCLRYPQQILSVDEDMIKSFIQRFAPEKLRR